MARSWWPHITRRIGIDLGTERTRIWVEHKGVVLDQPTVLASDKKTGKVLAVGQEAAEMEGRVGETIQIDRPLRNGKLTDMKVADGLLRVWMQELLGLNYIFSPVVMVSVPAGATQASRQAIVELITELGAREVYTIAQPLAAAIGAGVPVADASGTLLCQFGAGVVEATLISLGGLVRHQSTTHAGDDIDRAIQIALRTKEGLIVSLEVARKLKEHAPQISPTHNKLVTGQDVITNAPKEIEVSAQLLTSVFTTYWTMYEQLVESLMSHIPPQLTVDVLDKGMLLSGGLAPLVGLEQFFIEKLGVPVSVVEEPDQVVIEGIGTALEHLDEYRHSVGYQNEA